MSTKKSKSPEAIKRSFEELFNKSVEERIEHRAQLLSYIFLSEAEKMMEKNGINKRELAHKIGTSSSYLTQLFRGDRLMNLKTAAKIEHALGMDYEITAKKRQMPEITELPSWDLPGLFRQNNEIV